MRPEIYMGLALLFLAQGVPSNAQSAEERVAVRAGAPLTVECRVRLEQRAEWRLDGGAVPADMRAAGEAPADGALAARLTAPAARAQHAGRYTCSADPSAAAVRVAVLPAAPTSEEAAGAGGEAPVQFYDVGRSFVLNCSQLVGKAPIAWSKNGTALESVWELSGRTVLEEGGSQLRLLGRSHEDDFGNYTCAAAGESQAWRLMGRPHARLAPDTNVVEGQKLKLTCKVVGKPYPSVSWLFRNASSEAGNFSLVQEVLGERAVLDRSAQGVEGAELVLEAARQEDAGEFRCQPAGGLPADTTLRVKDMYAALWPFLGICAEVFVLCAIILVYEKRRTKPELDDSDTDNHEQKKS